MKRLNLGAGNRILPDSINHDIVKHRPEIDIVWDLNKLPWPWADNEFDVVVAYAVLEHLKLNLLESMNEIWRILVPNGLVCLKVPYWNSPISWWDPTHYWKFDVGSFNIFDPTTKYGRYYKFYGSRTWSIVRPAELNKAKSSIFCDLRAIK